MSGKVALVLLELSRRHQIRPQLNDAQMRKEFLFGESADKLMKEDRDREKYRDFFPDEPIGDLGHASFPDIERTKCRATQQRGQGDLHALAHAAGIEQGNAIVRADMQAVTIEQTIVQ
jgi:hypothetical protein